MGDPASWTPLGGDRDCVGSLASQTALGEDILVVVSRSWSEYSLSYGGSPPPLARASWGGGHFRTVRGVVGRTEVLSFGLPSHDDSC